MTELKTLKDIPLASKKYTDKKLRQEAIKWIKEYMKGMDVFSDYKGRIVFIKDFFNITEEDLKNVRTNKRRKM